MTFPEEVRALYCLHNGYVLIADPQHWSVCLPSINLTTGDGEVYIAEYDFANGGYDPFIDAFGATTGSLLWHLPLPHAYAPASFQFANHTLYVSTQFASYALNPRTGEILWSANFGGTIVSSIDHGVVYSSNIFNSSASVSLYALNASDGKNLWQQTLSGLRGESQGVRFVNGVCYMPRRHPLHLGRNCKVLPTMY